MQTTLLGSTTGDAKAILSAAIFTALAEPPSAFTFFNTSSPASKIAFTLEGSVESVALMSI